MTYLNFTKIIQILRVLLVSLSLVIGGFSLSVTFASAQTCSVGVWEIYQELYCATDGACANDSCNLFTSGGWSDYGNRAHNPGDCCSNIGQSVPAQMCDGHGYFQAVRCVAAPAPPPNNGPSTPSIAAPSSVTAGDSGTFTLNSTDPDGDNVRFDIDWGGNGSIEGTTGYVSSGANRNIGYTFVNPGTVTLRARAQDSNGAYSGWATRSVTVNSATPSNSAPNTPSISGPTSGITGTSYSFSFNASDPDGDTKRYHVSWDSNTSIEWSSGLTSGSASRSNSWSSPGTYTIYARAEDSNGAFSGWRTHSIVISDPAPTNNAPNAPTISAPSSIQVGNTDFFTLNSTDPDSDNVRFQLDWGGDGSVESTTGYVSSGANRVISYSFTSVGTVTLRARAQDSNGAYSGWATRSVTVTSAPSPVSTFTINGQDGSSGAINVTYGTDLDLVWSSSNATACYGYGTNWSSGGSVGVNGNTGSPSSVQATWTGTQTFILDCPGATQKSIDVSVTNGAPNAPIVTPAGSNTNEIDTDQDFTVQATDTEGNTIFYEIDWDMDGTVDESTASVASGVSVNIDYQWSTDTTHTFQVRARETANLSNISAWTQESITLSDPHPVPSCPIAPAIGRTIVDFGGVALWSSNPPSSPGFESGIFPVALSAGQYDIRLVAWDGHIGRSLDVQPNEEYQVVFMNGSTEIVRSSASSELSDGIDEIIVNTEVDSNFSLSSSANGIKAIHPQYLNNTSANSVYAICASFDEAPPNLTEPGILIEGAGTQDPITGEWSSVRVRFTTRNDGLGDITSASDWRVRLDVGNDGSYDATQTGSIGLLPSGGSLQTYDAIFPGPIAFGDIRAEVFVDVDDDVIESDETDNLAESTTQLGPPDPQMTLDIVPSILVRSGDSATLEWAKVATYPMACTLNGPGISTNVSGTGGSLPTAGIDNKSEYIFTCTEPITGASWSRTASVETTGSVEEI